MSRVGNKPIPLPKGVKITIGEELLVEGPKGKLRVPIPKGIEPHQTDGHLEFRRDSDQRAPLHGLTRALAAAAVQGVSTGFVRELDITGVGYRADVKGNVATFTLGYSHPIEFPLPEGIEAKAERMTTKGSIQQYQTTLTVSGIDKQRLGQVCAEMHKLRKPDAYKGKGVRYADVPLKLKPGKTGK